MIRHQDPSHTTGHVLLRFYTLSVDAFLLTFFENAFKIPEDSKQRWFPLGPLCELFPDPPWFWLEQEVLICFRVFHQ